MFGLVREPIDPPVAVWLPGDILKAQNRIPQPYAHFGLKVVTRELGQGAGVFAAQGRVWHILTCNVTKHTVYQGT
jgi:hypothetical protein